MTMHREEMAAELGDDTLASAADECAEGDPSAAVMLFRSLAEPARLRILQHLMLGEHRVVDLTNHLGLAQSTTSAHLVCLRDCGLVSVSTVGRSSVYSLAAGDELVALLSSAERLLAATGDAVTLCTAVEAANNGAASTPEGSGRLPNRVSGAG